MKKIIISVVFLGIIITAIILVKSAQPKELVQENEQSEIVQGQYCFSRFQQATESAPYQVEEHIVLNILDGIVTGTKQGTQSGPDMTNGYQGNLDGTIKENVIEAVYAFTIEGSENKELEVYEMQNDSLVKMRWVLVDDGTMLVPDRTTDPAMIPYMTERCS